MEYYMFIDDERNPADVTWSSNTRYAKCEWVICRNAHEVNTCVKHNGMPTYISFDHDLGENKETGYDIAKSLILLDMDKKYKFPENFDFSVHSKNPIGAQNIKNLINGYFKFISESKD